MPIVLNRQDDFCTYQSRGSIPSGAAISSYSGFAATDAALGSVGSLGATVTVQIGFDCYDMLQGLTNYGFRGQVSAGTNKYNLYMSGTAANYFAGPIVAAGGVTATVAGTIMDSSAIQFAPSGTGASTISVQTALRDLWYDVKGFGAAADGTTDDTTAVQAAITAAFNAPGGTVYFPAGQYKITSGLTLPDTAGAIRFLGGGKVRSFTGGTNSDPTAVQGAQLTYSGTTGDVLSGTLTGSKRQYISIENLAIQGNVASGSSGHGIHWQTSSTTSAFLVSYRDVTVNGAKQHGIFHDGNVFECVLINVRLSQNGDRGFKAAANGSALPGETGFIGVVADVNGTGVDLGGGGHFSFHRLTCTSNTNEGLVANSVNLEGIDLQLETNGTAAGNQATLTSLTNAEIVGINCNVKASGTGNGISMVGCLYSRIVGYKSNSSTAGVGYKDFRFDNTSSRCAVYDYTADDFVDRYALGTGGGHEVKRGNIWLTGQGHNQNAQNLTGNVTPDVTQYDDFCFTYTSGANHSILNPTMNGAYHNGQQITIEILNSTGGAVTTAFDTQYALAGAWTDPANTKRRTITFHWNNGASKWVEVCRAAADI